MVATYASCSAEGLIDPDAETVLLNTGDGLKTLDAVAPVAQPTVTIDPSYAAFAATGLEDCMAVSVRIPTILRTYTGGASVVEADGDTLTEVLSDLDARYPGIRARVLDDAGALRRFVNVYVNDDDVRFADGLATSIGDGSTVSVIPAVAGG